MAIKVVLEMFEFVTNELQYNKVSISRVYPCFIFLKTKLLLNIDNYKYTKQLRKDLYDSLMTRFSELVKADLFQLSTLLDPNFGLSAFDPSEHSSLKVKLKQQMLLIKPVERKEKTETLNSFISSNYVLFENVNENICEIDDFDSKINSYLDLVSRKNFNNALDFWRCHEKQFPIISQLAKKFLGVQASSACVERMFSIAGHIFTNKRRRTGVKLFENLVFMKLNENYL